MRQFKNPALLIFLFCISSAFAQTDSCNKLNLKGKKIGYWITYLDENINPTDSANACFWGYEFYDEGTKTFDLFNKKRNGKNYKVVYDGTIPQKGKAVAINGTFKYYSIYNESEELESEETYKDGFACIFKAYMFDKLWTLADFTKKYNNTEGTFYSTDFRTYMVTTDTRYKTTCYWYRKEKNKWIFVETPCE
jgi:hypothetical protein